MKEQSLSELTVTHRGVPIGTVQVVEIPSGPSPTNPPRGDARDGRPTPSVRIKHFRALAAFATLKAPILRREEMVKESWTRAMRGRPSAQSRAEANAAWAAMNDGAGELQSLAADMELHDDKGTFIPAVFRVEGHAVFVELDEAAVGVQAWLRRLSSREGEPSPE